MHPRDERCACPPGVVLANSFDVSKNVLWLVNVNVPADLVVTSMKNMKNLQKVPVV